MLSSETFLSVGFWSWLMAKKVNLYIQHMSERKERQLHVFWKKKKQKILEWGWLFFFEYVLVFFLVSFVCSLFLFWKKIYEVRNNLQSHRIFLCACGLTMRYYDVIVSTLAMTWSSSEKNFVNWKRWFSIKLAQKINSSLCSESFWFGPAMGCPYFVLNFEQNERLVVV